MACLAPKGGRTTFVPEFARAVDSKEFLDKGASRIEHGHLKRCDRLVVDVALLERCAEHRLQPSDCGGMRATAYPHLNDDRCAEILSRSRPRFICKDDRPTDPTLRPSTLAASLQSVDSGDSLFDRLHIAISSTPRSESVGFRSHEEIYVLREAFDEVPALRQTRSTLEDNPFAKVSRDHPERLGYPIVFFNQRSASTRRLTDCREEVSEVGPRM